jgi:hypothetical protein
MPGPVVVVCTFIVVGGFRRLRRSTLGWLPGCIEVTQGNEAFLNIRAGSHLLGAADRHAHRTLPYQKS